MASFELCELQDDPEGWGPASNSVPEHLKYLVCPRALLPGARPARAPWPGQQRARRRDRAGVVWWVPCGRTPVRSPRARLAGAVKAMPTDGSPAWPLQPFAPFSKNDRVGRACEWNFTRERERFRREWQRYDRQGEPSPFVMEQVDEEGFHLVEQKTPAKPKWGPGARGGRGGMRGGMRYAACTAKRVRQRGRCDGASHSVAVACARAWFSPSSPCFSLPSAFWGVCKRSSVRSCVAVFVPVRPVSRARARRVSSPSCVRAERPQKDL